MIGRDAAILGIATIANKDIADQQIQPAVNER
jgi:hypothetical protein